MPRSFRKRTIGAGTYTLVDPSWSTTYVTTVAVPTDRTEQKINSFARLQPRWDYGHGGPIARATLDIALVWNQFLQQLGLLDTDAFPGGEGEVVIAAGYGDHYFEIIVEPDHSISIAYDFKNRQALYEANLHAAEAATKLMQLTGQGGKWNWLDYFTQISTTRSATNLQDLHSGILGQTTLYQLLVSNALKGQVLQSATTFDLISSSPESSASLPFFGDFNPTYFHQVTD